MKFYQIYKASYHYMDQSPSKAVSGNCPSRELVAVNVVQTKIPIVQKPKQLSNYSVPNDQNKYNNQQYNARPNGHNWQNNNQSN